MATIRHRPWQQYDSTDLRRRVNHASQQSSTHLQRATRTSLANLVDANAYVTGVTFFRRTSMSASEIRPHRQKRQEANRQRTTAGKSDEGRGIQDAYHNDHSEVC